MKEVAYVVLSCDPYSDVWDPYGRLFEKFWSDCPFDTYLASNHIKFDKYGFKPLLIGDDVTWSNGLMIVLNQLKKKGYKYIIAAFDDFLITSKVDNSTIIPAVKEFIKLDGNCLRFDEKRSPKIKHFNQYFGEVYNHVPYRLHVGFTVWKISTLEALIDLKESAWEFEKNGSERTFAYDKFYCLYKNPIEFMNLIIKRKLVKAEFEKLKSLLPYVKFEREIWTPREENFKDKIFPIFKKYCPVSWQLPIYKFLTSPIKMK